MDILFLDGDLEGDRLFCGCISLPTGDLEEEWEWLRLSLSVHFLASRFGDSGDCCLLAGDAIRRIGGGSGLVTFSEGFDRSGVECPSEELSSLEESELLSSEDESELLDFEELRDLGLLFG